MSEGQSEVALSRLCIKQESIKTYGSLRLHRFGDADTSCLDQALHPSSVVDPKAVDLFPFHIYIPKIETDSELHLVVFR